jgi:hypothetical protein
MKKAIPNFLHRLSNYRYWRTRGLCITDAWRIAGKTL